MPQMNVLQNGQVKAIDFAPWGGIDGFLAATSSTSTVGNADKLRKAVPWLNKGIGMTANAVSQLPYAIENGETEMDLDTAWGAVKNPQTLIYKTAAALCGGAAYWQIDVTSRAIVSAQYLVSSTMTPNYDTSGVLVNFTRQYNRKKETLSLEQVVYFWLPDDTVETGPAQITPLGNALLSAGIIAQMDNSVYTQSERGFIPPFLLSVKGMPSQAEAQKAETSFNAWLRGWTGMIAKLINSESTSLVPLGANMADLKGTYTEVKKSSIEDIASAFGIPAAIFMSDMAFATEVNPLIRIWYTSSQIVSIYQTIEDSLTDQLWNRFGYEMEYQIEQVEAFQKDEVEGSSAVVSLAGSIDAQPEATLISMSILGYDLTEEQIADIEGMVKEEPEPQPVPPQLQQAQAEPLPEPTDEENDIADEVMKWREFVRRPRKRPFETKHIPPALAMQINNMLQQAKTPEAINKIFDSIVIPRTVKQNTGELTTLADAINNAAKSLTMPEPEKPKGNDMTTVIIDTQGNALKSFDSHNESIMNAIKTLAEMYATKEAPAQIIVPAPLVTVEAAPAPVNNITVQPAAPAVNNITVQPAPVILPALPTEAKITTDKQGNKTMKVTK